MRNGGNEDSDGVRQVCVLSSLLFNIYAEFIFRETLEHKDSGILLNGERVKHFHYGDNMAVFADSMEVLQDIMNRIAKCTQFYGLGIYKKKVKKFKNRSLFCHY